MPIDSPEVMDLKFDEWRQTQLDAFEVIDPFYRENAADNRNFALEAPTGVGKTGIALGLGYDRNMAFGERTLICVATVQEQRQYIDAFKHKDPYWFASLSGRGRYHCNITNMSEADSDPAMEHRAAGCEYYYHLDRAQMAPVVVVNYALARVVVLMKPDLLDAVAWPFDNMILDECHDIHKIMEDWFSFRIKDWEWQKYIWDTDRPWPKTASEWYKYAEDPVWLDDCTSLSYQLAEAESAHYANPTRDSRNEVKVLTRLEQNFRNLRPCIQRGDVYAGTDKDAQFTPAFPPLNQAGRFYGHSQKRIFMSGTIMASASNFKRGVGVMDCEIERLPNPFPPENSPLFFLKGPSLAYKTRKPASQVFKQTRGIHGNTSVSTNMPEAIEILDNILDYHPGRVMVHAHSNLNAKIIGEFSEHRSRMLIHDSSDWDTLFATYRNTPGAVLVAAGRTEALDLPGDLCEAVVMFKLPFAPFNDVERARAEISRGYYSASMLQAIRQARGRGVRTPDDVCPCYVVESDNRNYTKNAAFKGVKVARIDPPPPKKRKQETKGKTQEKQLTKQAQLL